MRALDRTLGPRVVFQSAASKEQRDNLAPCFGPPLFVGDQRRETETLTVTLKDVGDRALWATSIEPKFDQRCAVIHGR